LTAQHQFRRGSLQQLPKKAIQQSNAHVALDLQSQAVSAFSEAETASYENKSPVGEYAGTKSPCAVDYTMDDDGTIADNGMQGIEEHAAPAEMTFLAPVADDEEHAIGNHANGSNQHLDAHIKVIEAALEMELLAESTSPLNGPDQDNADVIPTLETDHTVAGEDHHDMETAPEEENTPSGEDEHVELKESDAGASEGGRVDRLPALNSSLLCEDAPLDVSAIRPTGNWLARVKEPIYPVSLHTYLMYESAGIPCSAVG
jgi:hypothetical protein